VNPDADTSVGIGLIGCGQWGLNYLRAFSELEGSSVVAACDLSAERLRIARRRSPGLRTTTNVDDILADSSVHAVVVATQATSHFSVASAALRAGKHCLVEKPLTTDEAEARSLGQLARAHDRILMVGHVFLYNGAITYVRHLIDSAQIGKLEYVYFTRTNLGPIRSDVNVVWDLMTHDVSILLHLLHEKPTWVSAQGASFLRRGCEDVAFATVGFDDGTIANIRASWLDPRKIREITLVGTSKMVVVDDLGANEPVRVFDKGTTREPSYESFGEFKLLTRSGDVVSPAIASAEPLKNQCQHFIDAVAGKGPVLSDAADGLRVVEIISAINRSIAERGAPISLVPHLAAV
jgi:predicted dehydrogenase